jgi:hypothetical protein
MSTTDDSPWYLTTKPSAVSSPKIKARDLGQREYWCIDCELRVTQTRDGSAEYGHGPECEFGIRGNGGEGGE